DPAPAGERARPAVCRSRRPGLRYPPASGRRRRAPAGAAARCPLAAKVLHGRSDGARGMSARQRIEVGGPAPYAITIGPGLLADREALAAPLRGRHVLLASDSHVAPLYAAGVRDALLAARPDVRIDSFVLAAGEASKTLAGFGAAIDALAALGATRDACVYALGGGVVGDLAGFAAACWMRGI